MPSYENYDLQEIDPYLIEGSTCLVNCLGITDTKTLNVAETEFGAAALAELIAAPIDPTFDLQHLQNIHQHLFRDVYPQTQRVLLDQLAERSGYAFVWAAISGEQMALACCEARTIDENAEKLCRLLQLNIITLENAAKS